MSEQLYHLVKNGLYYRPEARGYTGDVREAGLFSLLEATLEVANTHETVQMIPAPLRDEGSSILASNLEVALMVAIREQTTYEKAQGFFSKSAYRAGLEANLDHLLRHGTLEVI